MLKNAVNIKHWNDCSVVSAVISELEESSELQLFGGGRYRLIYYKRNEQYRLQLTPFLYFFS